MRKVLITTLLPSLSIFVVLRVYHDLSVGLIVPPNLDHHSLQVLTERRPRLGDGCYHVYIDVGANIGVHGRFLFEPQKYRKSWGAVPLFSQRYGENRSNEDYCAFEIEANPRHWGRLNEISKSYNQVGWRYHVIQAAASDQNGTLKFFHQGDDHNNELGFSMKKRHLNWSNKELRMSERVATIRLAEWIKTEILQRKIPKTPLSGNHYEKPIIGMKLDIEGSEYVVLPDLMLSGVYCEFDFVFGETHPSYAPLRFKGHKISLEDEREAKRFERLLRSMMKSSRQCRTHFYWFDEETYHNDGKALPSTQ